MATVAASNNDLAWGPGKLLLADVGSQPTEEVGQHSDPMTISVSREVGEQFVQEVLAPVNHIITSENASLTGALAQVNISLLERLLGIAATGSSILFGSGSPQLAQVALRLISTVKDGRPMHLYAPRAHSVGALEMVFGKDAETKLPFELRPVYDATLGGMFQLALGTAAETVTIATGAAARTNANPGHSIAWLKLSGESAAADALTDITAAGGSVALANNEVVRVQITATTMPITVTHASGVIETKTSADFVLTKLADWIDLYYDLANTTWKEIARYDAP